jgi:hypothetical protein
VLTALNETRRTIRKVGGLVASSAAAVESQGGTNQASASMQRAAAEAASLG